MPELLILRHSIAKANEQKLLMGSSLAMDSGLSEAGTDLARVRGSQLKSEGFLPTAVYCSELTRTKQTAHLILEELDLNLAPTILPGLNERDFGQYSGKPHHFIIEAFDKFGDNPPTVEPVDKFVSRVIETFENIKQQTRGTALIISHSNPIMVMQTYTTNPTKLRSFWELGDPDYCEGFTYRYQGQG